MFETYQLRGQATLASDSIPDDLKIVSREQIAPTAVSVSSKVVPVIKLVWFKKIN